MRRRSTAIMGKLVLAVRSTARDCPHTSINRGQLAAMSIRSTVPALLWWLFWVLVAILLLILAALVIHHFGGFNLSFHVGDFHFQLGVTGH
jgi:hypothetical protein